MPQFKSGVLTCPASTGTQAISGLGFTPKAVIFTSNEQGAGAAGADLVQMLGMATSATNRWVVSAHSNDNVTTTQCVTGRDGAHCISLPNDNATTTLCAADLDSLDADGFTLDWTTVSSGVPIFWTAIGGDDVEEAHASFFDMGAATGNASVIGPGFQPNVVLFAIGRVVQFSTDGYSSTAGTTGIAFGAATSSTSRWTTCWVAEDNQSASDTWQFVFASRCCSRMTSNGSFTNSLDFVSMDESGFTVDRITASFNSAVQYLALKLTNGVAVGVAEQPTSTTTVATTGVGFTPAAILTNGNGDTGDGSSVQSDCKTFFGFAMAGAEHSVSGSDTDGADPTETGSASSSTKFVRYVGGATPSTVAEANVDSFDGDGFTSDWTTADAVTRHFGWVAFEGEAAPTGTAAQILPPVEQSASGTSILNVSGTASQTLGALEQSATGTSIQNVSGSAAQSLPALGQAATGKQAIKGSAAQTLPPAEQAATGKQTFTGAADQALPPVSQSASGSSILNVSGAGDQSLPALTQAVSGAEKLTGQAAQALPAAEQAAQGTSILDVSGTAAQTLAPVGQAATGSQRISGAMAQSLPALAQVLSGSLRFSGTVAQALPALTQAGSGTSTATAVAPPPLRRRDSVRLNVLLTR